MGPSVKKVVGPGSGLTKSLPELLALAETAPFGPSEKAGVKNRHTPIENYAGVWDAPQGPSGEPSIPEKIGISETMTGVSDLLTAKNRHTCAVVLIVCSRANVQFL